ncbi:hypothetical protein [Tsukamurella pulmonis]|uniref:hypothetical protein n=1 Tax=Tsukamurella pulmonis TaxID=47312 RepID=UPI000E078CEE|nr:hypothetical protein [Tsukamurella pulmonis]SUP21728.1 Uncharacterised protein [Tsukamurella pulmonis]
MLQTHDPLLGHDRLEPVDHSAGGARPVDQARCEGMHEQHHRADHRSRDRPPPRRGGAGAEQDRAREGESDPGEQEQRRERREPSDPLQRGDVRLRGARPREQIVRVRVDLRRPARVRGGARRRRESTRGRLRPCGGAEPGDGVDVSVEPFQGLRRQVRREGVEHLGSARGGGGQAARHGAEGEGEARDQEEPSRPAPGAGRCRGPGRCDGTQPGNAPEQRDRRTGRRRYLL